MAKRANRKKRDGVRSHKKPEWITIEKEKYDDMMTRASLAYQKGVVNTESEIGVGLMCLVARWVQVGEKDAAVKEAIKCFNSRTYADVDGLVIVLRALAEEYSQLPKEQMWIKEVEEEEKSDESEG